MDNARLSFGLLNLVYWDDWVCIKISIRPISATITKMEGTVDKI